MSLARTLRSVLSSAPLFALAACAPGASVPAASTVPAATCGAEWLSVPAAPDSIAVPGDAGGLLAHLAGKGTQNFQCVASGGTSAPSYDWTFIGPEALLTDCSGKRFGQHGLGPGGTSAPEWKGDDGSYVVGYKLAGAKVGGAPLPWLLLSAVPRSTAGSLSSTQIVRRLNTQGGEEPVGGCDAKTLGKVEKVPYSADYYFYGHGGAPGAR